MLTYDCVPCIAALHTTPDIAAVVFANLPLSTAKSVPSSRFRFAPFRKRHRFIISPNPIIGYRYCNGTRSVITQLHDHIIDATATCRLHPGKRLFIPRTPLVPSDNISPLNMKRIQFPISFRPAFAVAANKAEGQTLKKIGNPLHKPFFSHGELPGNTKDPVRIYTKDDPLAQWSIYNACGLPTSDSSKGKKKKVLDYLIDEQHSFSRI
ncbi:ATP-dependent DNA helicase PIF1 [Elysia marginata]|uniref:ATP-dependent DNA helicase PIF1 n=1 Tax=Elysia marginata TaxID=1093978 RepID=A0AAV4J356_9GAST|nr:ATP-dependent DNA helicase PIF1 [Elysia marginata]